MNLELLKLPFKEEEIEWRIGQCGKKGNGQIWATCLAYVSARAIMNRLDEVCGPENWKVNYWFPSLENVICQLSINIKDNWVVKEDGAEQTDIESFKGGISSALKRAGSVWGIGRYLYGLDTGFAKIVEQRSNTARYGKTKDGTEFYWESPKLPQWALPSGEIADTNGIHPEIPKPGDGIQKEGFLIPPLPKPLLYLLGCNPAGKLIEEIDIKHLETIAAFAEDKYNTAENMPTKTRELYQKACAVIFEFNSQENK